PRYQVSAGQRPDRPRRSGLFDLQGSAMAAETGCTSRALPGLERARPTANGITGWPGGPIGEAHLAELRRRVPAHDRGLAPSGRPGAPPGTEGAGAGPPVTPAPRRAPLAPSHPPPATSAWPRRTPITAHAAESSASPATYRNAD